LQFIFRLASGAKTAHLLGRIMVVYMGDELFGGLQELGRDAK
jgi:hypothetical protein